MKYLIFAFICLILVAVFLYVEYKKKYVPAVILKGLASLAFVLLGILGSRLAGNDAIAKNVIVGLVLGCIADVMLNLRFVFPKIGQKIFLVGILIFLAGHVMYLVALIPQCRSLVVCLIVGVVLTFLILKWIFSKITAKKAFKIFGVFYIGAITIMTCVAAGVLIGSPSSHAAVYFIGAVLFLLSDIVLILNTFGSETKESLRIVNISLYYLGQIMIALSLQLL